MAAKASLRVGQKVYFGDKNHPLREGWVVKLNQKTARVRTRNGDEYQAGYRDISTGRTKPKKARKGKGKRASMSAAKKRRLQQELAADWARQERYLPADWERSIRSNPRKGRRVKPESIRRAVRQQLGAGYQYMHGPTDERTIQKLVAQGHTIKDAVRMHYIGNPARRGRKRKASPKRKYKKNCAPRSYKKNCGPRSNPPRDSKGRFKKVRKSRKRRRR